MRKKIKAFDIILIVLSIIMFFVGILKEYLWESIGYIDDLAVVLLVTIFIFRMALTKKTKFDFWISLIFFNSILLIVIGTIGNYISNYQTNIMAQLVDILSWQKFFLVFFIMYTILEEHYKVEKYYKVIIKLSKIFIISGIVVYLMMLSGILDISTSIRYGITSLTLGGHPSYACAFFSLILSILLYDMKKNKIWIILSALLIVLTFRAKGIGFVALIFLLKIMSKRKIDFKKLLIVSLVVMFIVRDQIAFYFLNPSASRAVALITAFNIANAFFPIGSGFATFGTVPSITSYSKAYEIYGLSQRWGFSKVNGTFVGDGGWATIIGQFGYIGIILCVLNLIYIYKIIKRDCGNFKKYFDVIAIMLYTIISSTNEIFFNSDISVLFAIALAILIHKHKNEEIGSDKVE